MTLTASPQKLANSNVNWLKHPVFHHGGKLKLFYHEKHKQTRNKAKNQQPFSTTECSEYTEIKPNAVDFIACAISYTAGGCSGRRR
jgi:hypothetical protein